VTQCVDERPDAAGRTRLAVRSFGVQRRTAEASPPPVHSGDVIGEFELPHLQVFVMVFEGDDAGTLSHGAGHIPGTTLQPGSGNIGIAAHRDSYFRPLRVVHADDIITLETPESFIAHAQKSE